MKLEHLAAVEKLFSCKEDLLFIYDKLRESFPKAEVLDCDSSFFSLLRGEEFAKIANGLQSAGGVYVFDRVEVDEDISVAIGIELGWLRSRDVPVSPIYYTLAEAKEYVEELQCDLKIDKALYIELLLYTSSHKDSVLRCKGYPRYALMKIGWDGI